MYVWVNRDESDIFSVHVFSEIHEALDCAYAHFKRCYEYTYTDTAYEREDLPFFDIYEAQDYKQWQKENW